MKRFILVLAILAAALPVAAHDPIQEAQEAITDLKARADLADSRGLNQGAALEELFRLVDNLNARVDALAGGANNQSAAINDLYGAIARINKQLDGTLRVGDGQIDEPGVERGNDPDCPPSAICGDGVTEGTE